MAKDVLTWPEFALELYDKLTERGADVTYDFENVDIYFPAHPAEGAPLARWRVNGVLKIRTWAAQPDG